MIRGFAIGWILLVVICGIGLAIQTQSLRKLAGVQQPQQGGEYSEALVGQIGNLNPILPENSATSDVDRLLFRGLMRYSPDGDVETDLASGWSVSKDGKTYTFQLRHGVKWHDNVPFTAQDVVFTLAAIQNPDTRSPLASSWQGVKAQAVGDYTVIYTLPKPFTPFIAATTVGLLPRHLLETVDPKAFRLASFNQNPVGLGPYKVRHLDSQAGVVQLEANNTFYGGKPSMGAVTLRSYRRFDDALAAYRRHQVLALARVPAEQAEAVSRLHDLKNRELSVPDEVAVFFRTSTGILSDKAVRHSLVLATDRDDIVHSVLHDRASALASPLLPNRIGIGNGHQSGKNLAEARSGLDAAGWKMDSGGIRTKDGKALRMTLVTQSGTVYDKVAQRISRQWRQVGADISVVAVDGTTLQQSYIRPRHYDMLLYGINVGPDPDVYGFWDSSQATDPGLNISSYSSPAADKALESARVIGDRATRAAKYKSFVATWIADAPAAMLYSPTYLYAQDKMVQGLKAHKLIDPADRFYDIEHWTVRSRTVFGD